jgi:hypothetical protein
VKKINEEINKKGEQRIASRKEKWNCKEDGRGACEET